MIVSSRMGLVVWMIASAGIAGAQGVAKAPAPWLVDGAVAFKTDGLAVDADGAPNSYLVDGNGLSYTCDGVEPIVNGVPVPPEKDPHSELCHKAWVDALASKDYSHVKIFGMETDAKNTPVVQSGGDPLPGTAYVAVTSMSVPGSAKTAQKHWVDATRIPYVVLSGRFAKEYGAGLGSLAVVYWPKNDKYAFGVYADSGGLGESSVKLHEDLGSTPVVKDKAGVMRATAGISGPVLTLVFPKIAVPAAADTDAWYESIQTAGKAALGDWGGLARLQACAKAADGPCATKPMAPNGK